MRRCFFFLVLFVFQSLAYAQPLPPEVTGAEPAWADGPSGAFRPFDGGLVGDTWYVHGDTGLDTNDGSEGAPFETIARGLEAASAGDTVVVRTGVYAEQIIPPDMASPTSRAKPLTLLAEPADGTSVVLDGAGQVPVVEGGLDAAAGVSLYRDSAFVVQGFRIQNWPGYGLAVVQSSDVQVLDCSFADNGTDMADSVDLVLLGSRDARVFGNSFSSATERGLDDRATDSWIAHNSFSGHTRNALKIGPYPSGVGSRVEHNRFVDNPANQGVVLAGDVGPVSVRRNLILRGSLQGLRIDGAEGGFFELNTVVGFHAGVQLRNLTGCRVRGNIAAGNVMGFEWLSLYLPDTDVDYNLYHQNTADVESGEAGQNALFVDPGFADPGTDVYELTEGGGAVNAGPPDLLVPEGGEALVDLGAYELGAGPAFYAYQSAGAVADLSPAFSWVYADLSADGVQAAYRVQLDSDPSFDTQALIDSNWQTGPETSWTVPAALVLVAGRWYVRVKTRDEQGREGPWSTPHLSFDVNQAPGCAVQGGTGCEALAGCDGSWLPAADDPRCCLGTCVACADADGDGYPDMACDGSDCDDADANVNPAAEENCNNGIDDDCDDMTDLGDGDCGCVDHDQDGYGENCPAGFDCDDSIASVNPGAEELCNYVDDDCDGQTDEGVDMQTDPDNCGECFWQCRAAEVCDRGNCADSCGGGRTECDRACIDTQTDLENCGGCDLTCYLPHASESCSAGTCVLTLCEMGWVDGNADPADGCEYECLVSATGEEECGNGLDDNCDGQVDEGCGGDDGGGGCGCNLVASAPVASGGLFGFMLLLGLRRLRR